MWLGTTGPLLWASFNFEGAWELLFRVIMALEMANGEEEMLF